MMFFVHFFPHQSCSALSIRQSQSAFKRLKKVKQISSVLWGFEFFKTYGDLMQFFLKNQVQYSSEV